MIIENLLKKVSDFFKGITKTEWILTGAIAFCLFILVFLNTRPNPKVELLNHTVDSLQVEINKKFGENVQLDSLLKEKDDSVIVLNNKLAASKAHYDTIYKEYEKNITVVDGLNVSELQGFFAKRYEDNK